MRILASDLDGTFFHGGIDDKKRDAVSRWRAAGNLFGLVSGRGLDSLIETVRENNIECDYLIAFNGALIGSADGRIFKETRCEGAVAAPLMELLFKNGCESVHVNGNLLASFKKESFCTDNLNELEYFNQISTVFKSFEESANVTRAVKRRFGEFVNPLQNDRCLDIVPKGMTKAQGIYLLLEIFGGKKEDVIAVGDNINDYHMISEFYSYAMANGVPSIKELADNITPSVTELIERELAASKEKTKALASRTTGCK